MQNIFDTLQSMPFYGIIAVDILPLAFKLFACNYDFFLCLCYIFVFILPRNNFYMQIYIVLFFCAYVRLPRHTHCPTKKLEHIREIISLEHLHNKKKQKNKYSVCAHILLCIFIIFLPIGVYIEIFHSLVSSSTTECFALWKFLGMYNVHNFYFFYCDGEKLI